MKAVKDLGERGVIKTTNKLYVFIVYNADKTVKVKIGTPFHNSAVRKAFEESILLKVDEN